MSSLRLSKWADRAHHRLGVAVRNAALRDLKAGQVGRVSIGTRIAQGLSVAVLAIPVF